MTAFDFETDEKSAAFCRAVADRMQQLFGISEDEAVGRVNRQWEGMALIGDHVIYHETPDYWANTLYYGRGSRWWANPADLKPEPYP